MKALQSWACLCVFVPLGLLAASCAPGGADTDNDTADPTPAAEPASSDADKDDSDGVCRAVGAYCTAHLQCCSHTCFHNHCRL